MVCHHPVFDITDKGLYGAGSRLRLPVEWSGTAADHQHMIVRNLARLVVFLSVLVNPESRIILLSILLSICPPTNIIMHVDVYTT